MLITIWYKTLTAVNDVSSLLQSGAIKIDDKLLLIGHLLEDFKRIWGSRLQIFKEAVVIAGPLGFETELAPKRKRKSKRFSDQKKEFKVHIFNIGLDSLI